MLHEKHLNSRQAAEEVHQVLGILGNGAGGFVVFPANLAVGDPAIGHHLQALQHQAHEFLAGQRAFLVDQFIELRWISPGIDQLLGQREGGRRGVGMAKPAGVGGDCGKEVIRHDRGHGHSQRAYRFMNEPARCLGTCIHKANRSQIVLRGMVIDDHFFCDQRFQKGPEVAELIPGAGVHHDGHFDITEVSARRSEALDAFVRIEEVVARRPGAGNHQPDLLAELPEGLRQAELRAQAIGIRPNMGRYQKTLVPFNQTDKGRPIKHALLPR